MVLKSIKNKFVTNFPEPRKSVTFQQYHFIMYTANVLFLVAFLCEGMAVARLTETHLFTDFVKCHFLIIEFETEFDMLPSIRISRFKLLTVSKDKVLELGSNIEKLRQDFKFRRQTCQAILLLLSSSVQ